MAKEMEPAGGGGDALISSEAGTVEDTKTERVCKPDIIGEPQTLYKKPGYGLD